MSNNIEKQIYFGSKDELDVRRKQIKLEDVCEYTNGKPHEKFIIPNGVYKVINSKFISQDGKVFKTVNEPILLGQKHNIAMTLSDIPNGKSLAKTFFLDVNDRYTINQRIALLNINPEYDAKYINYLLSRNKYFLRYNDGVNQTNLSKSDVLNFQYQYPSSKIQFKISHFLSQIDNLIEHQTQKYHELQSIKICLLNTFFSKDRLVNNQFIPLADFCNGMKSGGTPKATEVRFYGGNIPFMSISDIKGDKLFSTKKFITEAGLNNSSSKIIDSNNIIYTMYATPGIAFTTLIDVAIPQSVISIELKDKSYNYYIKEFLNYSRTDILKFAMTGTQSNLTGEIVKNIKVPLMNIADVEKITYILSQMDKLIEIEEKKLEQLEKMKKYHLQQFFN